MLRVYALWHRNRYVLIFLATVWAIQIAFGGNAMVHSESLSFPSILLNTLLLTSCPLGQLLGFHQAFQVNYCLDSS